MKYAYVLIFGLLIGLSNRQALAESRFSAVASVETRFFTQNALQQQDDTGVSLSAEAEWYIPLDDSSVVIKPFFRFDEMDQERTHVDIREAYWQTVGEEWSMTVGINKVFWGVAETQHLVDIINQTDGIENIDGEDKLGQPMVRFSFEKDWGTLSFFALPWFRERTFAGEDGRLRLLYVIDTDASRFESGAEQSHLDFAVRFTKTIDEWDIGLAHFRGTSREPLFNLNLGNLKLEPFYPQISQTSLDVQATLDNWLLKLELIYRTDFGQEDYIAAVGGFEYSFYGVMESAIDIGWILEYQYDQRNAFGNPLFQVELSDVIVSGARIAFNDEQSSELLFGLGFETDNDAQFMSIEGSRRIGDSMKLVLEGRIFTGIDPTQPQQTFFYSFRRDDFLQITLESYF